LTKFKTYDSAGILFMKKMKIPIISFTSKTVNATRRRPNRNKLKCLGQGISIRIKVNSEVCKQMVIDYAELAHNSGYSNIFEMLKVSGYSVYPSSTPF
jgi:3-deoxy-D-manno-octulosonate 8-phosphate phosphatase KdsC-like HAD superfamily phosphatase